MTNADESVKTVKSWLYFELSPVWVGLIAFALMIGFMSRSGAAALCALIFGFCAYNCIADQVNKFVSQQKDP